MTTTSLIRHVGSQCGFEYSRTIATLEAFARCSTPVENAGSALRTLRAKRAQYGGTHFVVTTNGAIRSREAAA